MSPNDKFVRGFYNEIIANEENPYKDPTDEHLKKFTIRLILRRFFFYVRKFIEKYSIYEFDNECDSKIVFTISDLACRSFSYSFKELEGEDHGRNKKEGNGKINQQGRSLELILLISSKRNPEYQTDEEKAFLHCIDKMGDAAFPLDKKEIGKLNFVY